MRDETELQADSNSGGVRGAGYLDTTGVHAELGPRSVRSGLIVGSARAAQGLLALGAIAVLARLLRPSDFGVIAMVTPFATVASNTLNFGLDVAVLHEERLAERQVTRLFWTSQWRSLLLVIGMAALGWPLASLYREPRVVGVAILWAVALALQSLGAFHEALLKRQLRLGLLTLIRLSGVVLGVVIGIVAAWMGMQHLAIMLQLLTLSLVECVGAWMACRWRPGLPARREVPDESMRRLTAYGGHLTAFRAVYWMGRQVDRILVGRIAGAFTLGLYDGARRWSWYPFQELFQSLTDVAVTTLSRARLEAARYRGFFRAGMAAFLAVTVPAVVFLLADAEPAVRVLLGERWLGAVPLVRVMCLSVIGGSLARITHWLFTAEGRMREQLRVAAFTTPIMIAAVVAGAARGPTGVAWAFTIGTTCLTVPTVRIYLRDSVLTWRDFAAIIWRPVAAATVAAFGPLALRNVAAMPGNAVVALSIDALIFGVLYGMLWLALPGGRRVLREMLEAMRRAVEGARLPARRAESASGEAVPSLTGFPEGTDPSGGRDA